MKKNTSRFDHEALGKLNYPTPYFLFSKTKLVDNFNQYKKNFPGAHIQYAMKANFEPEVLQVLDEEGCGFEVASAYELRMLKGLKVDPKKIVYGTSVKPLDHIKEFFEYGVDRFAFDTFGELEKIASVAPGSRVYARMIANDAGSVFQFSKKFGTEAENIAPLLERARELGLVPYGISFHVGSQASNPMAWASAIQKIAPVLDQLKDLGIKIEVLDIGGGYPCTYASAERDITLEEISANISEALKQLPYQPTLMLEPGRGMIADTGVLVASIIGKVERSENTWLFLDAGTYNALYEAMVFQGSTRYHITSMRPLYNSKEVLFAIAGPTGDSQDVLTKEALLPQDIEVGDKLIIHDVGAYSLVATNPFNGFPKPQVYFE